LSIASCTSQALLIFSSFFSYSSDDSS